MKLIDILLENTIEYRVKFTTIIDKDVSQGSASYKDLDDAKKFFDGLKRDPEVYRAELEKVMGADSSRDMAGASFMGGTQGIERYSNPATKGLDQGGKDVKDLTPTEFDMRVFANSRMGTISKKGFTSKDGTYKYLEEALAKSAIMRQIKDAEEILDSGEADGVPLDNETEMLVQQELTKLKKMLAMNEDIPDVNTDFSIDTDFSDLKETYNKIK